MTEGGIAIKRILCILLALIILLGIFAAPAISGMITTALHHIEYYGYTREALNGVELPYPDFFGSYNAMKAFPVVLAIPDETGDDYPDNVTFFLRANCGSWMNYSKGGANFYYDSLPEYLGPTVTLPNGEGIYWDDVALDPETGDYEHFITEVRGIDEIWLDGIVYQDSHIIGFFVVKHTRIYHEEYGPTVGWKVAMVGSASFPKVDGEYQEIRPECIEGIITHLRNTA